MPSAPVATGDVEHTTSEAGGRVRRAGLKAEMIFPQTARAGEHGSGVPTPHHVG